MPRKEVSQPVYTRDMKELADEFNIFYTSAGVKVAEESKKIAIANNLTLVQPNEFVFDNNTDEFCFYPVASKICQRVVLNQLMEYMYQKGCLTEHQSGNNILN